MNNIPTAEEFFKEELSGEPLTQSSVVEGLITFTKLHVEAALEKSTEQAILYCLKHLIR